VNWTLLATVFSTVFLAELGDKTQLATMLFAARGGQSRLTIFLGAAAALVLSSALGVLAGALIGRLISPRALSIVAGAGFVVIGVWTIFRA
jgi:putative Ca2+/H+ antiporter (TMEM165/GDT1 family)